jgi:FkbM family methyltransferase
LSNIKKVAKSCAVLILGHTVKPRRILRGLASGYTITVSPPDHLSYLIGTYEPHLLAAIKRYVSHGDIVYDIGANIGYLSLALAKQVGPKGYVAAFEAVRRNADSLRENIRNNRLSNIHVFDVAAADKPGQATIRFAENLATASLVWHKGNSSVLEEVIDTIAVDDLVDAGNLPGRPKFIKIDVEGA